MANQPYLPLYTGDWKKDHELSLCSLAARGAWIDLLCSMHDGRVGNVTGTAAQIAQLCRTNAADMTSALLELQATGAANVSERNGVFTVVCRRMKKALEISRIRAEAGSKGGKQSASKSRASPEYESEDEGLRIVREFAKTIQVRQSDADWFFWKCHGNGWTNGGKPMRDWEATLRSWMHARYLPSQKTGTNGARPGPTVPARTNKPQPEGWEAWRKEKYPESREHDFWRVPDDVKAEFRKAT